MRLFYFICFLLLSSSLVMSCSKNEQAVEEEIFLGVGKWKIKKGRVSSFKKDACDVTDLILNSDSSFKIYISDNTVLIGTYSVYRVTEFVDFVKSSYSCLNHLRKLEWSVRKYTLWSINHFQSSLSRDYIMIRPDIHSQIKYD